MLGVLRNRFDFSEALDLEGFHREAEDLRVAILCVMASNQFSESVRGGRGGNERYAIRGELSWEDVARSTASGAAGGAVAGAMGGLTAAPGAVVGGALGLASQPIGAMLYKGQGATSKAESQSGDRVGNASRLAGMLSKMGAGWAAQQIMGIAQVIQQRIQAVRTQRYDELSKQYGLSGASEKGMWGHFLENVTYLPGYLGRTWNMIRSEASGGGMARSAAMDQTGFFTDARTYDDSILGTFAKPGTYRLGPGGLLAGGLVSTAVDIGWNKVSDAIKGQTAVMQNLASDIVAQAAEMSRQTQDPTYIQYGQQIGQIFAQVLPMIQQQAQQQAQQQGYGQQGYQQPQYGYQQQGYYPQQGYQQGYA